MTILDEIFAHKRHEVQRRQQVCPLNLLQAQVESLGPTLDFIGALKLASRLVQPRHPALIAEVKAASPSRGMLSAAFDPLLLARLYAENGAAAISVLTDERYFQGSLDHMRRVAAEVRETRLERASIPLLQKDFIFDPYQLYEARCAGADAILLIVAALEQDTLRQLHSLSLQLGLAPLVEVHSQAELQVALGCGPRLLGINNRNLKDFTVNLETTLQLRSLVPAQVCLVSESGIHTLEDIQRLASAGVDAVLVGEALVTASDVAAQVRSFSQLAPSRL